MSRPLEAVVNLHHLRHNLEVARSFANGAQCIPVIKANAYGHGAVTVARTLNDAGLFAVACIEEALELRQAGIRQPVLLLEGFFTRDEVNLCLDKQFIPVIHETAQLKALEEWQAGGVLDIWLKLNTGMNRLGISCQDFPRVYETIKGMPAINLRACMTHFARADEPAKLMSAQQLESFCETTADLPAGIERSTANSAALLTLSGSTFDYVRPGIMLYGSSPFSGMSRDKFDLRPVMTLSSRLIAVRQLQPGDIVGYGATWVADRPIRMGVVAGGYGDGYPRHAPTGTPVFVGGSPARIIGRVSMDMITLDLTDCPGARVGDVVEFWGSQVSIDQVADYADTIPYELMTGLTRRVPCRYIG